ncbi:MAG TPA: kelch repeat-containing protein [Candidatus Thermoplasmatota archaeon]|nr:kelch repeat-containing protein [Candidatus Thermoplasmatota archaeon]
MSAARASAAVLALLAIAGPAAGLLLPVNVAVPCGALAGAPVAAQLVCGRWDALPPLPAPREGLSAAFARSGGPVPGLLYAFGGRGSDGQVSADFWVTHLGLDGWLARAPGPPARADAAFVVDDRTQTAYLFGGRDAQGARNDLWAYDLQHDLWTQIAAVGGPTPTYGMAAGWDPDAHVLWVFGGSNGAAFNGDLWGWDADDATWVLGPNAPQGRQFASGAWDAARHGLVIAGGADDAGELPDVWIYQPATETWKVQIPLPEPLAHAAATWWPQRTNLLVLGGVSHHALTDRAMVFGAEADFGQPISTPPLGVWLDQAPLPSARADAGAAWEFGVGLGFLVGGRTASGPSDEAWVWFPSVEGNAL